MNLTASPIFEGLDKPGAAQYVELREHVATDASFSTAYLRAVGAIAASDGVLNIADFNALDEVFALFNDSALAQVVLLECIDRPVSWIEAFRTLKAASAVISLDTASMGFEAVRPLLRLQGLRSRELAEAFGEALQFPLNPIELAEFATDENSLWDKVSLGSVRIVKGRQYAELADLCVQATGDLALARAVLECESGALEQTVLAQRIIAAAAQADKEITEFGARIADFENTKSVARSFVESVHLLQQQVRQRLAIADARIAFERQSFDEDLEEYIYDAGNAFARDAVARLSTDKWKSAAVWEDIGKSTFGKELERRLGRIVSRREESLGLIRQDLQLFKEELLLSRTMIWKRMHHTQLSSAAPGLRWGTRIKNGVETVANTTLWVGGGIGAVGAGAAYFLGASAVLPVVAPAIPVIGGAMLFAGAIKWLMNPTERKNSEIEHQRKHFEKAFRLQLDTARAEINRQLDATAQKFHEAAEQLVRPIVLEAQAADQLSTLKLNVARRLSEHTRKALAQMRATLAL